MGPHTKIFHWEMKMSVRKMNQTGVKLSTLEIH